MGQKHLCQQQGGQPVEESSKPVTSRERYCNPQLSEKVVGRDGQPKKHVGGNKSTRKIKLGERIYTPSVCTKMHAAWEKNRRN